jgi:hypothetical protein
MYTILVQGKTEDSLDWEEEGASSSSSDHSVDHTAREFPLQSIVMGIATAILLVMVVIAVAVLVRCGGSSASTTAAGRRGGGWRDKHTAGSSSPDLLVQIESGNPR